MKNPAPRFSHLVVIGASAGGIESLSVLVSMLPSTFAAPIVIAQHLSPTRDSALGDILARRGPLPVRTIQDPDPLEPGVIYVVPPNSNVVITDHEVRLNDDVHGAQPSIDLLFTSASEIFQENLIAVVLSGTGSDGAMGARAVKNAGGTVVIQNPDTAAYPGMPLSLARSNVNIVANRERIADILTELVAGTLTIPPATEHSQVRSFLNELRDESGIDFTSYKEATIERRLQRRMVVTGKTTIADYVRHVHTHPDERQHLVNSFLIKVTEFFRDPVVYTYLREQVLPELIRTARERGTDLRIWSAGSATGEEPYSLAMIVSDLLADHGHQHDPAVRIYATDLDEEAVAFARRGIYPARTLENLPPGLLERHFVESGEDFEVRKELRGMIVFGAHDLGQRSPFPRIDLILCRNVLIYFTPALQRRALQLFAFSLRLGGYLTLGKSETVSPLAEYFTEDQPTLKVYRRSGDRALIPPSRIRESMPAAMPLAPVSRHPAAHQTKASRELVPSRAVLQGESLMLAVPFGVIVVDQNYDIHTINGEARRLFGIHSTASGHDLIHLIQYFDPMAIRKAIDSARPAAETVTPILTVSDTASDLQQTLEISCTLMSQADERQEALRVVTVIDVTTREQLGRHQEIAAETLRELTRANEDVLTANEKLMHTITRLRAQNEEMLVAAEEIQAATEEVETLNEELQASNEELETLNEELQATVEELNTTNADLQSRAVELQAVTIGGDFARQRLRAILDGVEGAVAVVDTQGTIIVENEVHAALFGRTINRFGVVDDKGIPLPIDQLPIARAIQGDAFVRRCGLQGPDGTIWVLVKGSPILAESDDRLFVISYREDSTGAKSG